MTKGQRITLMADWWPKACRAQGWDKADRDLRMRVLSEAVGRPLESASDLNNTDDIDKVVAHLAKLSDDLGGMVKHETPDEDEAVRWRWVVKKQIAELAPLLDPLPGESSLQAADRYAAAILRDRFQGRAIDTLSLKELRQLKITLTERTKALKKQAVQPF